MLVRPTVARPDSQSSLEHFARLRKTHRSETMASPDVVCQPCGSALGAPTKECSASVCLTLIPSCPGEELAVGAPTSDTRGRNGRRSCSRKHLTSPAQPLSRCIATSRPSAGAAVEKNFTRCRRAASGRHDCPLCRFGGAKMWLKKDLPDGRQVQRIFIPKRVRQRPTSGRRNRSRG